MLRDDQELTPEITQAIIERFRTVLGRLAKSETWAARSMAMPPSTLSQVLNGNYEGDAESRIRKIDKWTDMQAGNIREARPGGFARTSVALEIIGAAKIAVRRQPDEPRIAVVHGPSGIGKTLTAQYLLSEIPGSIYIRITTAGCGVPAIYDMLMTAMGLKLPRAGMSAYQVELTIREALADTNRLLIVDEVHKLCKRGQDNGLHSLRDLQDATKIPMLLLGTADVATYIESGRDSSEAVEQLYGRVCWWQDLSYAASRADDGPGLHTIDDIRKVLAANQLRVTPDVEQHLKDLANEPKMGGLRTIVCLCRIVQDKLKLGEKPITLAQLLDVQNDRLGQRAAKVVAANIELRKRRKVG